MPAPQDVQILEYVPKSKPAETVLEYEPKRPPWYDNYLGIVRHLLAGAQQGAASGTKTLLKVADFISDKLGIRKSDAARMIARDLETYAEANRKRGVGGIPGKVAEGIGQAAFDIPVIASLGPAGLPVHGAVSGLAEGGIPGAVQGAAAGTLSHGILKGTSGMNLPGRIGAGAAFGAATTPGGIQERVAGAATMGGLGVMGGKKQPSVIDMRGRAVAKPTAAQPVKTEAPHLKELTSAIRSAKAKLPELEELRSEERGKRLSKSMEIREQTEGIEGFLKEKAALGGELPKLQFESIFDKLAPEARTSLFEQVKKSPLLTDWEKISARDGLLRVMNQTGGSIPQPKQLELLHRVFGQEFTKAIESKLGSMEKFKKYVNVGINIPRTLMSVGDVSGGFRQGVFFAGSHPVAFARAVKDQFKYLISQGKYEESAKQIAGRPTFPLMEKYGLALMDTDSMLNVREEKFMGSGPLEKIPVVGSIVRGSNRAYTGMLNQIRADVFDSLVRDIDRVTKADIIRMGEEAASTKGKAAIRAKTNMLYQQAADLVNTGTGRGSLGKTFNEASVLLNATLFSPRLMSSRLHLLNPLYYYKLKGPVRKEAIRSLLAMIGVGSTFSTLATLAAQSAGIDAGKEPDPRSSDFMKIRLGKTRIDPWGGFQPYIRLMAQLVSGQTRETTTGKIKKTNRLDTAERFLTYKEAPVMSFITDILRGRTAVGETLTADNLIVQRILPMAWQDLADVLKEEPELAPVGLLSFLGFGVQTYEDRKKRR